MLGGSWVVFFSRFISTEYRSIRIVTITITYLIITIHEPPSMSSAQRLFILAF